MFDAKPLIQKLLRKQESLSTTQKDFAQLLGVSSPTVSRWRKGQGNYNPTLEQLGAVADKLGTTVVELLTPDIEPAQVTPATTGKTTVKKADTKEDKPPKAAAKTSAAKAKKVNEPTETAKKGRKTAIKAAKASATPDATADTEKTAPKKRGRPKKGS